MENINVLNKRKKLKTIHLQFVYTFFMVFIMWMLYLDDNFKSTTLSMLIWINNINFIFLLFLQKRELKGLINPVSLYSIILFLFSSGQLILYSLGLNIEGFNVFERLGSESLKRAIIFIILGYTFFQLGIIYAASRNKLYSLNDSELITEGNSDSIYKIGFTLASIGAIPYFLNLFNNLSIVLSSGYSSYYREGVRSESFLLGFSYYFFSGLVLVVIGGTKRKKIIAIIVLLLVALLRFIAGDRGDGIVFILTAYLLYKYFIKKGKDNILQILIIGLILMSLVPTIGVLRNNRNESFIQILSNSNIFTSTLSNLGGTIWPLAKIIENIPSYHNFIYGASYLSGFSLLIPSPLRFGPISSILSDTIVSSPASWLQTSLNMSYGPGFTPFAESFLNFGWWGIIFMVIFGIFVGTIFSLKLKNHYNLSIGINILSFQLLAMSSRGSFNNMIAFYVRYVLFPLFLIFFYNSFVKKKK